MYDYNSIYDAYKSLTEALSGFIGVIWAMLL